MLDHHRALLGQAGVRRDRFAAERGLGLPKEPGPVERRPADHHTIDVVAAECLDDGLRRGDVAVADEGNAVEMRLDAGNLFPIGRTAEHVGGRAAVDREGGSAGVFHGLGNVAGVDRIAARAETDLGSYRRRGTGIGHGRHDLTDAVRIAQ